MITLRILNPEIDSELFKTCWRWQFEKPGWWLAMFSAWRESEEEFLERAKSEKQIDLGVFDGDKFSGLITLTENFPGDFEVGFDCPKRIRRSVIREGVLLAKDFVFSNGVRRCTGYVATENAVLQGILLPVGFKKTNVSILKGAANGKILVWDELVLEPDQKIRCPKINFNLQSLSTSSPELSAPTI